MFDWDAVAALAMLGTIQMLMALGFATRIVTLWLQLKTAERAYRLRLAAWTAATAHPGADAR